MKVDHLPEAHRGFLERNLPHLKNDHRFLGLAVIRSAPSEPRIDLTEDLKLILVVDSFHHEEVLQDGPEMARHMGHLLSGYYAAHSGDRDQFTCLFDQPLLHVDFYFRTLEAFQRSRKQDREIIWERGHRLSRAMVAGGSFKPQVDPQWIEDRIWVWTHYLGNKLAHGELFEVIDGLGFLRLQVLAPLARFNEGLGPQGLRTFETDLPHIVPAMCKTLPTAHDYDSVSDALTRTIDLYCDLREDLPVGVHRNRKAEKAVRHFLESLGREAWLAS